MAETAIQRLKRLAAEKKATTAPAQTPTEESKDGSLDSGSDSSVGGELLPVSELGGSGQQVLENSAPEQEATTPAHTVVNDTETGSGTGVSNTGSDNSALVTQVTRPSATHPIAMEMAELEQALDAQVPGFITILKDIHIKLREDPNTVTLLTEEEIAVIVKGLERHANVTISAKAAKSTAKARKVPIAATDL